MRQSIQKILWLLIAIFLTVSFSADAAKRYKNVGQGNYCCKQVFNKKTVANKKWQKKSNIETQKTEDDYAVENKNRIDVAKEAKWANHKRLKRHFKDHGSDFNSTSEEDYAKKANAFYERSKVQKVRKKLDEDKNLRIWDEETNEFGSYNYNGETLTYYKPNPNIHKRGTNKDYWDFQDGKEY